MLATQGCFTLAILSVITVAQHGMADDPFPGLKKTVIRLDGSHCKLGRHASDLCQTKPASKVTAYKLSKWKNDGLKTNEAYRFEEILGAVSPLRIGPCKDSFSAVHPSVFGRSHLLRAWPDCVDVYMTPSNLCNAVATMNDGVPIVVLDANWTWRLIDRVEQRLLASGDTLWKGLRKTGRQYLPKHEYPPQPQYENENLHRTVLTGVVNTLVYHEIGHILYAHLDKRSDVGSNVQQELEADSFAGYNLGYGAAISQSSMAELRNCSDDKLRKSLKCLFEQPGRVPLEVFGVLYGESDTSHPRFAKRVTVITKAFDLGYKMGTELEKFDREEESKAVKKARRLESIFHKIQSGTLKSTTYISEDLLK